MYMHYSPFSVLPNSQLPNQYDSDQQSIRFYDLTFDRRLDYNSEDDLPSPTIDIGMSFESLDKTKTGLGSFDMDSIDKYSIFGEDSDGDSAMHYLNSFMPEEKPATKPKKEEKREKQQSKNEKKGVFSRLFKAKTTNKSDSTKNDQNKSNHNTMETKSYESFTLEKKSSEKTFRSTLDGTSFVDSVKSNNSIFSIKRKPSKLKSFR
ncbi:uncharacterized protein J8A68_001049 [[Candida] subhashii]|uniref:Uncharacterized protein n=1 Tax=[Candida] subhashii TaxID=561895 RepID=A0A8J5QIN5_9ASCO|nr:uncharacterized protein J8A68_001049 [[Candida] subhashii]KAG7665361.1 hypothetical protein J8A68_001049 [[Candida] subhashii]